MTIGELIINLQLYEVKMSLKLDLNGKTAVLTGAGGALAGSIARALAKEGVNISIWDISEENGRNTAESITAEGGKAVTVKCDVTDPEAVNRATNETVKAFGTIDLLVNGAGGSLKNATTSDSLPFFDIPLDSMEKGLALNYFSVLLPCQFIGKIFAEKAEGCILNISSIAGIEPLTRAVSYSDSKAAVNSFTRWLAVHMASTYSNKIRVNAIAPGFMLTEQNRFLLIDEKSGGFTDRGNAILNSVPMSRLGEPDEITGAALWLLSDQANFVTGAVIPIDGGYTAHGGV